MNDRWPVIVLGGSGYVAGEFLRLVAAHPRFELGAAVSTSQAGERIGATFGHLAPVYGDRVFLSLDAALERLGEAPRWLVLSAAPHGASAGLIGQLIDAARSTGVEVAVVDASADFRFADPAAFAEIYGHAHALPDRLADFRCAVPEHLEQTDAPHAAHPGCFATAMLLGIVPLVEAELTMDEFFVSAVTGSTGAGRTLRETTHHPVRQSNLFAYQALEHRHSPEVRALTKAVTARDIGLHFVPHSGPFARGIHATIFAKQRERVSLAQITEAFAEFYRGAIFVKVETTPPRLKDVVASNYAALSVALDADTVVVCCVLDNLLKGAAGGSVQWANRLLGLPESTGLISPTPGWL